VTDQQQSAYATVQVLLILLAPLWINAFVYMTLGRMIHFFLTPDTVFGIRAKRITLMFVLCDILSFLVQATGGSLLSPGASADTQRLGLHIYMGGVGLQLLFIGIFLALCVRFQLNVRRREQADVLGGEGEHMTAYNTARNARRLLWLLYAVLGLIVYRNIFRLVEFSAGTVSTITTHEWFAYFFDATPMLVALVAVHVFHPGRVLRGPNSDFSEERRREKAEKTAKKAAKRAAREDRAREKVRAIAEKKQEKQERKKRKEEKKADTIKGYPPSSSPVIGGPWQAPPGSVSEIGLVPYPGRG